jgi:aspartate racemase
MTKKSLKTIGVLGGMGPESTALFYQFLIQECQKQFGACKDDEYPEIIIDSLPIPDVVERVEDRQGVTTMMQQGALKLQKAGADFIVVPCNTVTTFMPACQEVVDIPILSIVDAVAERLVDDQVKKVSVFGTQLTAESEVYNSLLNVLGIESVPLTPNQQQKLTRAIVNIMGGNKDLNDVQSVYDVFEEVRASDVQGVVLGCTDLSFVDLNPVAVCPVYDSSRILAEVAIGEL